jgi:hypothetical protein
VDEPGLGQEVGQHRDPQHVAGHLVAVAVLALAGGVGGEDPAHRARVVGHRPGDALAVALVAQRPAQALLVEAEVGPHRPVAQHVGHEPLDGEALGLLVAAPAQGQRRHEPALVGDGQPGVGVERGAQHGRPRPAAADDEQEGGRGQGRRVVARHEPPAP